MQKITEAYKKMLLNEDQVDIVSMDVPFLIRLMEYSREQIKSDDELHKVATVLIKQSKFGNVTTKDISKILRK